MKINVHIERLVLEGLPVRGHERARIGAALEAELTRLLAQSGMPDAGQRGGAVPVIRAGALPVETQSRPRELGRQIARSVHGVLRGQR